LERSFGQKSTKTREKESEWASLKSPHEVVASTSLLEGVVALVGLERKPLLHFHFQHHAGS
jgi:hypothetical protein